MRAVLGLLIRENLGESLRCVAVRAAVRTGLCCGEAVRLFREGAPPSSFLPWSILPGRNSSFPPSSPSPNLLPSAIYRHPHRAKPHLRSFHRQTRYNTAIVSILIHSLLPEKGTFSRHLVLLGTGRVIHNVGIRSLHNFTRIAPLPPRQ